MRQFRLHFVRYCSRLSAKFTSNLVSALWRRTIWHFHRPNQPEKQTTKQHTIIQPSLFIFRMSEHPHYGARTVLQPLSLSVSLSSALVWPSVENSKRPKFNTARPLTRFLLRKRMKFQRKHTHTHTDRARRSNTHTHTHTERKIRELIMQQMMRTEGFRRMPPCIGCVRWCAMKFNSSSLSERTQENAG